MSGKIGIVDDDDAVRDAVSLLLRVNGFDVTAFNSGPSLLADAELDQFGCLILDVHMPTMSGIELLELLRRRAILVPVIMMTGRDDPVLAERMRRAGTVALMQKPVTEQLLISEVAHALASGEMPHT